jgi:phage tail-like protein
MCEITDLGSSNGTYIDEVKLMPQVATRIPPETRISIGSFDLRLSQMEIQEVSPPVEPPPPPREAAEPPLEAPPPPEPPHTTVSGGAPPPAATPVFDHALHSERLLQYLPGVYHTDFMGRFLRIFESVLTPIEMTVDNFDLYLHPDTAPTAFLEWFAGWYGIAFDATWSVAQRRELLREAQAIYARRGTRWALNRVIEIYTGQPAEIIDTGEDIKPFTFKVRLPFSASQKGREMIERIIDANKPAHTAYELEFTP